MHALGAFDNYRIRAVEAELEREGKEGWSGSLETDDSWQDDYVSAKKGALPRYFAR